MQKLIQHLRDNNLTLREFARRVDISPSFLSELTADDPAKRKSPSLAMALRIQSGTKGDVSISDWPKLAEVANAIHAHKGAPTPTNSQVRNTLLSGGDA